MYPQTIITTAATFIFGVLFLIFVPGVTGIWSIAALPIVSASALIFFGVSFESMAGVGLASVFLEIFSGVPLGTYPVSIVIATLLLMLAGNFLRVEPLKSLTKIEPLHIMSALVVSYVLSALIFILSYVAMSLAYGYAWSWNATMHNFFTLRVFGSTVVGILSSWTIWRSIQHLVSHRRNTW